MTEKPQKGLRISVFRWSLGDCTNNGLSANHDTLTVVGILVGGKVEPLDRESAVFAADERAPAVVLVPSQAPGYNALPHLVPLELIESRPEGYVGPMHGGNYAGAGDSRWTKLGKRFADNLALDVVAIHDRIETHEQYLANCD